MNFKIPSFYKRFLIFFIVIGPIFWLVFTEDGQRRTDIVLLTLWGEDELALNMAALNNQVSETDLKKVFPDITWACRDELSSFGNRICTSRIGIFNDIPAHYVSIFFHDNWINAVKVGYRSNYHTLLIQQLRQQLGAPLSNNPGTPLIEGMDSILHWVTDTGNIIAKESLTKSDEAALLWLSFSIIPPGA